LVTAKILVLVWIVAKICNIGKSQEASPFKFLDILEPSCLQIHEKSQSGLEQVREITIDFEKSLIATRSCVITKITAIVQYLYNVRLTQSVGG
jgi:hypothetical protein